MSLGILHDRHLDHVPGTSLLDERGAIGIETGTSNSPNLKHDSSGKIVLVPQPSDSPNDPLNWPRWKKEMFTVAFAFGSGAVGACGPLLSAALVPLAAELNVPIQHFTLGFQGSCIAALAVGSLIGNSLAVMFGRRPVYLATSLGLVATCLWSAETKSFTSLAISRAVQGFCMAPMEALVPASIADIWFVHERGIRNAIFNLGLLGGINLASPIAGVIIQIYGYRVCLYAMAGAFVIQLLLTFFFMPESLFDRSTLIIARIDSRDDNLAGDEKNPSSKEISNGSVQALPIEQPISFLRELLPWNGYYEPSGFVKNSISPFLMLASPIVVWGSVMLIICISWLVLIIVTLSQIFSGPPYDFSVTAVGLISLSSFMGTLVATAFSGLVVDGLIKYMSRKNNGIYEPEFRLPIIILYVVLTCSGFFAWGQSLHNADPWPIPVVVFLGMINLGVQFGATGVVTYVVDCHRERAAEAFAIMVFIKNMFSFGMTFYINDWVAIQGVRNVFFAVGIISIAIALTTVPMYIYGKRARSFAFRSGWVDGYTPES